MESLYSNHLRTNQSVLIKGKGVVSFQKVKMLLLNPSVLNIGVPSF